ncbi:hypothetical protein G6O69_07255 [Pseudenhygromyxa sp. WMMC2535]|uniref:hypothetical protein n=1 Tax=Pseudenhygromyxa sp. WMMC2535 TaxID=2712867 RepID=UPI001595E9FA|nr:hypothetical protein [Pseudenhygromyxa sp. WMMC2535]NVB37624.1 hypothetical protein [Pseudenhygromyxa sp. WMMC2535]
MRRTRRTQRLAALGLPAIFAALACAAPRSRPPRHDELVQDHLDGDYHAVTYWCPQSLDDPGADPALADWCMYGLPAAMYLSLDSEAAMDFMRSVCLDTPSGQVQGSQEFRVFYVRETVRWIALPLRAQRQESALFRGVQAAVLDFSAACRVDPLVVSAKIDTTIERQRPRQR